MQNKENIKEKIYEANIKAHNYCAKYHHPPIQYRKSTRNYIWNLIKKQLKKYNVGIENSKILEVACGTGTFVQFAQANKIDYKGFDISDEMIKYAIKINKCNNVEFENINLENFSKKTENLDAYDIILSSSFLHHIPDLKEGLEQIRKLLKPNGIYIALTETIQGREITPLEILDNELHKFAGGGGQLAVPFHKRLRNFLKYLLKKHNKMDATTSNNIDYVDYQLNFGFNLYNDLKIRNINGIEVIPYCYYKFPILRFVKHVNNCAMLIMRKR